MFNHTSLIVSDHEFEKLVPKLINVYSLKNKEFSFYQAGTGENLAIIKQEKDEKVLEIIACKKTGWRPNAKKLLEVMKASIDRCGELHLLVDMTENMAVYDFLTEKDIVFFGPRPNRGCIKKEIRNLAIYAEIDDSNVIHTKPVILCGYTDHLTNLAYFNRYGRSLIWSKHPTNLYGSKIVYKTLMEFNGFDPEASVALMLDTFISPQKGISKIEKYNFDSFDNLFKVNGLVIEGDTETIPVESNTKQLTLMLPGHIIPTDDDIFLSELVEELQGGRILDNCCNNRVNILMDVTELEEKFPYELHDFYRSWNTIVLVADKNRPRGTWKNKRYDWLDVTAEFKKILGFTDYNSYQFDFRMYDASLDRKLGITKVM